jgi:hypothetical protein
MSLAEMDVFWDEAKKKERKEAPSLPITIGTSPKGKE